MAIVNLTQNTPEWLAFRQTKIGASDINVIMGRSNPKYGNVEDLLKTKKTGVSKSYGNGYIAELGHKLEDQQRNRVELIEGGDFPPTVFQSDSYLFLAASTDGYNAEKNIIWEHKLVGKEKLELVKAGKMIPEYEFQVQQQLHCSGAKFCIFQVIDKTTKEVATLTVYPDKDLFSQLLVKAQEFYQAMQEEFTPEEMKTDYTDDLELLELVNEYAMLDRMVKRQKEVKKLIFERIQKEKVTCNGVAISVGKATETVKPDYEKYCLDNNLDLTGYTKTSYKKGAQRITIPKNYGE